jgi:ArsR family transcriptional regulator
MRTPCALDALFALSARTRFEVLRYLVQAGPDGASAGSIAGVLRVRAPTLSFHLKELTIGDLVESKRRGRHVVYTANVETMNGLVTYLIENFCPKAP